MHWFWRAAVSGILAYVLFITAVLLGNRLPFSLNSILFDLRVALFGDADPYSPFPAVLFQALCFIPAFGAGLLLFSCLDVRPANETRCRKCGYILRGLSEPRCPECGERI